MDTTTQIYQAINAISQRVNEVNARLDQVMRVLSETNAANIDYIAMMSDINIPSEKEDIENAQ